MDRLDGRPERHGWIRRWGIPVLAGLASAALTLIVAGLLAQREQSQFQNLVDSGAQRIRSEIRAGLALRGHRLSILAREWEGRLLPLRQGWESDVRLSLSHSPGLESIVWIEANGEPSWSYPSDVSHPAFEADALRSIAPARGRSAVLRTARTREGLHRLQIVTSLGPSDGTEGWLVASYDTHALFADILANADVTYVVGIWTGGEALFATDPPSPPPGSAGAAETRLTLPGGLEFSIVVEPSAEMLDAASSGLPEVTRAGGLALSLLLALSLALRNVAAMRADALQVEVGERARAESEIRRLNEELEERVAERTAELSRSNEELRRFASFLSHELRQPLGTQKIWLELLESDCAADLDEDGRDHLANLRRSIDKMSELIAKQLAISSCPQDEGGDETVSLKRVVREALAEIEPEIKASGARVSVGPLPAVRGDAIQLRQLFRNVIENAVKYARDDTTPEVDVSSGPLAHGESVVIRIRDNGRGFAAEDSLRIFEAHERLHSHETDGQGLGLAICRGIAERHGGILAAEGEPGFGATFTLTLPPDRRVDEGESSP